MSQFLIEISVIYHLTLIVAMREKNKKKTQNNWLDQSVIYENLK